MRISWQSANLGNLAVVYRQLGQPRLAQLARQQAEALRRAEVGRLRARQNFGRRHGAVGRSAGVCPTARRRRSADGGEDRWPAASRAGPARLRNRKRARSLDRQHGGSGTGPSRL